MGTEFTVSCHTAAVSPFLQPLPITVQGGGVESTKSFIFLPPLCPVVESDREKEEKHEEDQRKKQSQEGLAL